MEDQSESWWLDNKLHYGYLGFVISFLVAVSLLEDQGLVVHGLLLIHILLLIGKIFWN